MDIPHTNHFHVWENTARLNQSTIQVQRIIPSSMISSDQYCHQWYGYRRWDLGNGICTLWYDPIKSTLLYSVNKMLPNQWSKIEQVKVFEARKLKMAKPWWCMANSKDISTQEKFACQECKDATEPDSPIRFKWMTVTTYGTQIRNCIEREALYDHDNFLFTTLSFLTRIFLQV